MKSQEIKHLLSNPKALMQFQSTGQYKRAKRTVSTPLRELIESLPPTSWSQYRGIVLSPELGFNCNFNFNSLGQLYQWLGGRELRVSGVMAYESYINRNVSAVSKEALEKHCIMLRGNAK